MSKLRSAQAPEATSPSSTSTLEQSWGHYLTPEVCLKVEAPMGVSNFYTATEIPH